MPHIPNRRGPNRNPLQVHPGQHHAVKAFFTALHASGFTLKYVAQTAGLDHVTVGKWKTRHVPTVGNLEAALNTVGQTIVVMSQDEAEAYKNRDQPPCLSNYYLIG